MIPEKLASIVAQTIRNECSSNVPAKVMASYFEDPTSNTFRRFCQLLKGGESVKEAVAQVLEDNYPLNRIMLRCSLITDLALPGPLHSIIKRRLQVSWPRTWECELNVVIEELRQACEAGYMSYYVNYLRGTNDL